jgi:hypothetical protein
MKLFNTIMAAQKKAAEKSRAATFVFTNQMRAKFGAFGSEITAFGGPFRNMRRRYDSGLKRRT